MTTIATDGKGIAELLAEFEAAQSQTNDKFANHTVDQVARSNRLDSLILTTEGEEQQIWIRLQDAARRYIIARDFNEFDPGKADMLWKLKYGGAI